jgi:hypothetical protein
VAKEAFLLSAALPVLIFLPFHIELRYFAPWMPLLMLWLAKGIEALGEWVEETRTKLWPGASWPKGLASWVCISLTGGLLLYFLAAQVATVQDGLAGMNYGRREAGLWLHENTPSDALVMSRDTEVPFYAQRPWTPSPNEEYERYIAYVRKRGGQYLVVDEREATVIRPQLSLLMKENSPPPELRHMYTADDPLGRTVVYEVLY